MVKVHTCRARQPKPKPHRYRSDSEQLLIDEQAIPSSSFSESTIFLNRSRLIGIVQACDKVAGEHLMLEKKHLPLLMLSQQHREDG